LYQFAIIISQLPQDYNASLQF